MPIFANRHHLFGVSDRCGVSSDLTNLEFKIQIMKLIISDGGRGRYWYILHLPATKLSDLLKFIFATKWQIIWWKRKQPMKVLRSFPLEEDSTMNQSEEPEEDQNHGSESRFQILDLIFGESLVVGECKCKACQMLWLVGGRVAVHRFVISLLLYPASYLIPRTTYHVPRTTYLSLIHISEPTSPY